MNMNVFKAISLASIIAITSAQASQQEELSHEYDVKEQFSLRQEAYSIALKDKYEAAKGAASQECAKLAKELKDVVIQSIPTKMTTEQVLSLKKEGTFTYDGGLFVAKVDDNSKKTLLDSLPNEGWSGSISRANIGERTKFKSYELGLKDGFKYFLTYQYSNAQLYQMSARTANTVSFTVQVLEANPAITKYSARYNEIFDLSYSALLELEKQFEAGLSLITKISGIENSNMHLFLDDLESRATTKLAECRLRLESIKSEDDLSGISQKAAVDFAAKYSYWHGAVEELERMKQHQTIFEYNTISECESLKVELEKLFR